MAALPLSEAAAQIGGLGLRDRGETCSEHEGQGWQRLLHGAESWSDEGSRRNAHGRFRRRPAHRINGDGSQLFKQGPCQVSIRWRRAGDGLNARPRAPEACRAGTTPPLPRIKMGNARHAGSSPLHAASRRPIPRQGPKGDIPTAMARGLGLRERRNKRPRTRERRGPGGPGVERGSATPQAPEAPLSWRLEPSLAQARPWARERPAVAFLHAGVALFHARLAFRAWTRPAALGVIQAVPDCQPLIAGLLHLGVELTAVLFGLRDQRARVELAAVQLRLEQVMALAPARAWRRADRAGCPGPS